MTNVQVTEVTGYQWQCSDCFDTGPLEMSEEYAEEAGGDHECEGKADHGE